MNSAAMYSFRYKLRVAAVRLHGNSTFDLSIVAHYFTFVPNVKKKNVYKGPISSYFLQHLSFSAFCLFAFFFGNIHFPND